MEEEFSMFMNSKATGSVKKDLVEMFVMCRKTYELPMLSWRRFNRRMLEMKCILG